MKDTLHFSLPPETFARASLEAGRLAIPRSSRTLIYVLSCTSFAAMGALIPLAWTANTVPASIVLLAGVAALVCGIAASWAQMGALRRAYAGSTFAAHPRKLQVYDSGLHIVSEHTQEFQGWHDIAGASLVRDAVVIHLDRIFFHVVPLSAFESRAEAEEFARYVNEHACGTAAPVLEGSAPVTTQAETQAAPASPTKLAAFGRTMVDAFRLAFFLPVKEGRPAASWSAIFFLMAISILWPTLLAFPGVGLKGTFSIQALGDALFHIPLIFLAAIAAAHAVGRKEEVPRIFAAGLLISIFVDLAQIPGALLAVTVARSADWVFWFFPAWLILALGVFACRHVEPGLQRLGALAVCLLFLGPLTFTYRDRVVWQTALDPDLLTTRKQYGSAGNEEVIYRQPQLLTQALDAIRPGRKGVIDVFFVAMGGYADQDVFRREVDATTKLMAERFGAEGHSIRLINNHDTLHDLPIASKTSLRAALNRVASVMDKEEDVLVLFLTSHGSQKHVFSLQLYPLRFEDVDPPTVRALLDEAGIRNRVVIVSACYSGGFTKPLEDANTLVITAAAANKTSFGCSNEAEWTYFGKAYFDEALRTTHSFTRAFEIAKPLIKEREALVRADVSDPQMLLGAQIATKLEALERQLEGLEAVPATSTVPTARLTVPRDKYVEYVDVLLDAGYLEEIERTCRVNMEQRSPEATVRKTPDAFWGAHKSPEHWKRINDAWARYSDQFCRGANDKALLRETYLRKTRTVLREEEVDTALAFLRTEPGARWLRADQEANRQQTLELGRLQSDLQDRLFKTYREAETAALDAFQKSRK